MKYYIRGFIKFWIDYFLTSSVAIQIARLILWRAVEGAEYATIIGATETIKKYKPILLISIYHTPKDFFEIKPYLEKLDIGYTFMIRQSPYNVYWNGYELLGYIPH